MQPKVYPGRAIHLLILAGGLVLLAISIGISFANTTSSQVGETVVVESQSSSTIPADSQTKYRYSPSTPLTADTYPSVGLCARSFAVRIANGIRESKQFSPQTQFVIEIDNEIHVADNIAWQPSEKFITDFQSELDEHFPADTFVIVNQTSQRIKADVNSSKFKTLNIDFSHTAAKQANAVEEPPSIDDVDSSGSIQANWTIDDTTSSKITINYVTKPWVATDRNWSHNHPKSFGFYQGKHYKSKVIGFTNRLARSSQEASDLAMENAIHFDSLHYGARFADDELTYSVVDRFQQKLSTPSGDFWQEAVLVSVSRKKNATTIPLSSVPGDSAKLLLALMAGGFGVTWISSLLIKAVF